MCRRKPESPCNLFQTLRFASAIGLGKYLSRSTTVLDPPGPVIRSTKQFSSIRDTCLEAAVILFAAIIAVFGAKHDGWCIEPGFKQYTDPSRRFILDYPATMKVSEPKTGEVTIYHPKASLLIRVVIEKRPVTAITDAKALLQAFRTKLKEETKDPSILEEGKLPGLEGSQGYLICSFKNHKGIRVVQLVQYYVAKNRFLLLIISDRLEGFKNIADVIRKIHRSLRIIDPQLRDRQQG